MPTEDELRDLFASTPVTNDLDPQRVIARSRARRLPRQLAVGAIGTLAVAGIVVISLPALLPQQQAMSILATDGAAAPQSQALDTKRAPADKINLCTGTVAEPAPSFYGLELDVEFPVSAPAGAPVEGMVKLVNNGTAEVVGSTAASPAITVSQGGIVLWHSNGPSTDIAVQVDLQPGESLEYPASFTPVRCDIADDEAESFRADLPALPAGSYDVSAAFDFLPDESMVQQDTPGLDLVTGPRSPITLQ